MKNKKIPNTPKYKFGGFPKLEQGLKDYGLGLADQSLGMLGASNVIKDSQYSDTGFGNFMKKGSAISGEVGKVALPIAANIIAPGSGKFVSMGQQAIGQFNPQDPSQYDEQGNPINPNMQQAKQAIGMAGQIGSMAGGFMGKYGGQMKYAMGGMNMQPNSEVEGDEMITSNTPPQVFANGGVELASNNPYSTPTYKTNGASHENGGIPMNMAPGSIINGKTRNPLTGNKFTKDVDIIAKMENKYTKKAESGDKFSNTNAKLILPILAQKKDYLNKLQNAIIENQKQAKALKNGIIPSMDNEQAEPQGMSEASEGEYKYGGIHIKESKKGTFTAAATKHGKSVQAFASQVLANKENYSPAMVKKANFAHNAAGWKHEMGGVQLPYYNTDNAGNPIYAMGGGYPAMTNPYHNFRGNIPMYEDGGNMSVDPPVLGDEPKGAVKVAAVGSNYKPLGTFGNKEYFDKQSDKAISGGSGAGSDWENSIIKRLQSGVSIEELVKGGHGTSEGLEKYAPYYKPVYIEKFDNNTTTPSGKYDQRIDRKEVFNTTTNNPYIKYYDYPDANAGYSKSTRVAVDRKTGKPVDPMKSFDPKGNYAPSFTIDTGRDYYENTIKSSVPGTNPTNLRLENTGNLRANAIQTGGFKYGGQMPKYELGGGNLPTNFNFERSRAFNKEQNQRNLAFNQMTGNTNPGYNNSNVPESLRFVPKMADESEGEGVIVPGVNVPKYESDFTNAIEENPYNIYGNKKIQQNLPVTQRETNPNSKNFDWGKLAMQGANFLGQNAGNIYDLTRKNEPLETYDLMTAKYLDPTQAIAGENYIGRQTRKAIPGLVGGNAGAAMNLLGANKAGTASRIGRLRETYDNANAQIANQTNQFNTGIKKDQAVARAANAAALENVRSQAIHKGGESFGKMTKSSRQDNTEQDTLKMFQWRYKNEPGFKEQVDNFSTQNNSGEAIV